MSKKNNEIEIGDNLGCVLMLFIIAAFILCLSVI